jgi:hypothetical protein
LLANRWRVVAGFDRLRRFCRRLLGCYFLLDGFAEYALVFECYVGNRLVPDCCVFVYSLVQSDPVFRRRSMLGLSFVHLFGRVLLGTPLRGFLLLVVRINFLLGGSLLPRLPGPVFFLGKCPLHLDHVEDSSIGYRTASRW